jgi:hypothetical protein
VTRNKTITQEDCHEIFLNFLEFKIENFNTNVFTFIPKDVLSWETMMEKHHTKFNRSQTRTMAYYLDSILDDEHEYGDIRYTVTFFKKRNGTKNVYKMVIRNGESFSSE